jgi:hypothetical protein
MKKISIQNKIMGRSKKNIQLCKEEGVYVGFCRFGRYTHKRPGCQACGNLRCHQINLSFQSNWPGMRIGPHGKFDGVCRLVMGCHTHKVK